MYVLRDSRTKVALNSSYTPEGLYWTTNTYGKLVYFKNAKLQNVYRDNVLTSVKIVGDTRPSDKVYIEKFSPQNHHTTRGQISEYTWTAKAQQLMRNFA